MTNRTGSLTNLNSKKRRKRKQQIYMRDKGICQICFEPVSYVDSTLDHYPLRREDGGKATLDNLRLAHLSCNWGIEPNVLKARFIEMDLSIDELRFMIGYLIETNPNAINTVLNIVSGRHPGKDLR